jgi:hypothetical protein
MRVTLVTIILAGLFLPGCCTPEVIRLYTQRDTPEQSFDTFRTALRAGAAEVIWESLSTDFKEKYDVPGLGTFTAAYGLYQSDFDDLAAVLAAAEVTEDTRYLTMEGRHLALVTIKADEAVGEFFLIDLPTLEVTVIFEGEKTPSEATFDLSGADFSEVMILRDGKLYVGPIDNADLGGISTVAEVVRFSVEHRWLLFDIKKLINVQPMIDRLRQHERDK